MKGHQPKKTCTEFECALCNFEKTVKSGVWNITSNKIANGVLMFLIDLFKSTFHK